MKWLLIVFVTNGWGGGELQKMPTFPTEQQCKDAGKRLYEDIKRVSQFTCVEVPG